MEQKVWSLGEVGECVCGGVAEKGKYLNPAWVCPGRFGATEGPSGSPGEVSWRGEKKKVSHPRQHPFHWWRLVLREIRGRELFEEIITEKLHNLGKQQIRTRKWRES